MVDFFDQFTIQKKKKERENKPHFGIFLIQNLSTWPRDVRKRNRSLWKLSCNGKKNLSTWPCDVRKRNRSLWKLSCNGKKEPFHRAL
jgi:hypothetical protein